MTTPTDTPETSAAPAFPQVGDGSGLDRSGRFYREELQLALRNKAMPLEALRYDVTPTGMHYTLVHYDIPYVGRASLRDAEGRPWRLELGGLVGRPLSLSLQELQRRPTRTQRVTLECAGDGRALLEPRPISQPWLTGGASTAEWTGTPLKPLLEEAGLREGVREILFTGLDHGFEGGVEQDYQRSLPLETATRDDMLLAWAMNGAPLEPQHGYPLRLVVPGWYGMTHVKWLRSIEAIDYEFVGYQHKAYRYSRSRSEPGEPVSLIRVRSLMLPPGVPDYLTRTRVVHRGPVRLQGRAWSGYGRITAVEVSSDGGATWAPAKVGEPSDAGVCNWQGWSYDWDASAPGTYELCCRATDSAGNVQLVEQFWTARGMGNNMAHRVAVVASG